MKLAYSLEMQAGICSSIERLSTVGHWWPDEAGNIVAAESRSGKQHGKSIQGSN